MIFQFDLYLQAAFFGCEHNVDKSGHAVVVNKTPLARIPEIRFKEWIPDDIDLAGQLHVAEWVH